MGAGEGGRTVSLAIGQKQLVSEGGALDMHALEIGNPQKAALFLLRKDGAKGSLSSKEDEIGRRLANAFY